MLGMMAPLDIVSFCRPQVEADIAEILDEAGLGYNFVAQRHWLKDPDYGLDAPCVIVLDDALAQADLVFERIGETDPELFLVISIARDDNTDAARHLHAHNLSILSLPLTGTALYRHFMLFIQRHVQLRQSFYNLKSGHLISQNMIGESAAFSEVVALIKKVARTDAGVYIHGETGTGKELAARSIHYLGQRCDGPFIPVNCGALSDDLMLSELFGHEKGAFTGATKNHIGLIEQAHGGTLFLDEVDALSDRAQVTLLRYLQEQEFRPLGSTQIKHSDARVIV